MMNLILEKAILEQENEALTTAVSDLVKKNKELETNLNAYIEKNRILSNKNSALNHRIDEFKTLIKSCENEIEELDEECNRLSDLLKEAESRVIHYVAVSLDLELCVPLVSTSPLGAGMELMNKCLTKGIPYDDFKVFEKSELL